MSITSKVERTLLQDIEEIGLPLDTIFLVDICDKKEDIFGTPGKARRPVQKRFQKHKELSTRGYKKLLEKYDITPGPATLEAQSQTPEPEPEEQEDQEDQDTDQQDEESVTSEVDDEDSNTFSEASDGEKEIKADLSSAFGNLSFKASSSVTMNNSNENHNTMETPIKTPIKIAMFSPPVAEFGSPVPSMVGATMVGARDV
jgi:hypothetical protein